LPSAIERGSSEDEAAQRAARRRVERVTADVVLVALDAEAEPGLERVDVRA
jgi:hypothetical protein